MRLNHPQNNPPTCLWKIVFHETGPWCQKGWGLLYLVNLLLGAQSTIRHVCVCVCVSTADLCLLSQQKTTHSGTCLNRPIREPLPWQLKYWMTACPWVSLPSSLPEPFSLFLLSKAWPSHGWTFAAQGHLDYLVNILSGPGAVTSLPVVVSLANNENISKPPANSHLVDGFFFLSINKK